MLTSILALTLSAAGPENEDARPPAKKWWILQGVTLGLAAIATLFAFVTSDFRAPSSSSPAGEQIRVLPLAPDYHALMVASDNANRILLGTHDGIYESVDGGQTWQHTTLVGRDAMSLERARGSTVWAAGHDLLAVSEDGGRIWRSFEPKGLPSLDIHALAVDPTDAGKMYAAVAGEGLFRSADGGQSFTLASTEIGADVLALTLTRSGDLLASDSKRGLVVSSDGARAWEPLVSTRLLGLDAHPDDPQTVLAAGPGLLVSLDSGRSFRHVLDLARGAGPVAWAPSDGDVGYAVGFDRSLYRTVDRGHTWKAVT